MKTAQSMSLSVLVLIVCFGAARLEAAIESGTLELKDSKGNTLREVIATDINGKVGIDLTLLTASGRQEQIQSRAHPAKMDYRIDVFHYEEGLLDVIRTIGGDAQEFVQYGKHSDLWEQTKEMSVGQNYSRNASDISYKMLGHGKFEITISKRGGGLHVDTIEVLDEKLAGIPDQNAALRNGRPYDYGGGVVTVTRQVEWKVSDEAGQSLRGIATQNADGRSVFWELIAKDEPPQVVRVWNPAIRLIGEGPGRPRSFHLEKGILDVFGVGEGGGFYALWQFKKIGSDWKEMKWSIYVGRFSENAGPPAKARWLGPGRWRLSVEPPPWFNGREHAVFPDTVPPQIVELLDPTDAKRYGYTIRQTEDRSQEKGEMDKAR